MIKRALLSAAFVLTVSLAVSSGASAWVFGPKGNDTGGIIPWSPEAEINALEIADRMCAAFNWTPKRARITSMRRVYGDYIVYECVFYGPLRRNGPG
jgi:hypothetical protein